MKSLKIFFLSMLLLSLSGCAIWTQALNKMGFEDEAQQQARPADQKPLAPKPLKYDVPAGVEVSQRFELPPDADGQSVNGWLGQKPNGEWVFNLNGKMRTFYAKTRHAEIIDIRQVDGDDLIVIEQLDQPCGFPQAEAFTDGYSYKFVLVRGSGRRLSERQAIDYKPANECKKLSFFGPDEPWEARLLRVKANELAARWWIENHDFKTEFSTERTTGKKTRKLFGIFKF